MGKITKVELDFDASNTHRNFTRASRVLLFRHTDLDGAGTEIVAKSMFSHVEVIPCENWTVNQNIQTFIESGEYIFYDHIIVADISFNEEIANLIMKHDNLRKRFMVVDHHKTALWLNDYPFGLVEVERNGVLASGTSSLYEILVNYDLVPMTKTITALEVLVEKIRRYDTWEWHNVYDDKFALMLNNLFFTLGADDFINNMLDKLLNPKYHSFMEGIWVQMINGKEAYMLETLDKQAEQYIDSKIKKAKYGVHNGDVFAYVLAESHISQLGNQMCERLDIEFAVVLDPSKNKISLRSQHYDVSELAKEFGGGGHPRASGFTIEFDWDGYINDIFNPKVDDDCTESCDDEWLAKPKVTFKQKLLNLFDKFRK